MENSIGYALATALIGATVALGAATGLSASPAENTYIGLYSDLAHTDWCAEEICPGFCPLSIYAWVLPGYRGARAVEFAVSYPPVVIPSSVTLNCSRVDCIRLCLEPCASWIYVQCETDWAWVWRQDLFVVGPAPGIARVVPAPGLAQIGYASCEPGYPVYPMIPCTDFYFNSCGDMAGEPSTWGSIKSLYGR